MSDVAVIALCQNSFSLFPMNDVGAIVVNPAARANDSGDESSVFMDNGLIEQ